jgi:hypothetical protein
MSGGWVRVLGGGDGYNKINLGTKIFPFKLLIICNARVYGMTAERVTKAVKLYFTAEHACCCQPSFYELPVHMPHGIHEA